MPDSKRCFKCETVKPIAEFYKHFAMADGHLNKCKECTKKDVSKRRGDNLEAAREYDRERSKSASRKAASTLRTREWRRRHKGRLVIRSPVSLRHLDFAQLPTPARVETPKGELARDGTRSNALRDVLISLARAMRNRYARVPLRVTWGSGAEISHPKASSL